MLYTTTVWAAGMIKREAHLFPDDRWLINVAGTFVWSFYQYRIRELILAICLPFIYQFQRYLWSYPWQYSHILINAIPFSFPNFFLSVFSSSQLSSLAPSSSRRLCVAGWDGGFFVEEPFQGLPEVGAACPACQRHHHCTLWTQDLAAGWCGEETTPRYCMQAHEREILLERICLLCCVWLC